MSASGARSKPIARLVSGSTNAALPAPLRADSDCRTSAASSIAAVPACSLAAHNHEQVRRGERAVDDEAGIGELRQIGGRCHDARRLFDTRPGAKRGAKLHERHRILVQIGEHAVVDRCTHRTHPTTPWPDQAANPDSIPVSAAAPDVAPTLVTASSAATGDARVEGEMFGAAGMSCLRASSAPGRRGSGLCGSLPMNRIVARPRIQDSDDSRRTVAISATPPSAHRSRQSLCRRSAMRSVSIADSG